ncbi:MAG: hypothetical protein H6597_03090 [Flavobacteriales bacterium]|nr:hypothetical protein [Flavobacteriales bacterium]MCB9193492.1 hypothetical protein [Flavobacteriales bacterium]
MDHLAHSWTSERAHHVQRLALGAVVACAIALTALEWGFPGNLPPIVERPFWEDPIGLEPQIPAAIPEVVKPAVPIQRTHSARVAPDELEPEGPEGNDAPVPVGPRNGPDPDTTGITRAGSSTGPAPPIPFGPLKEEWPYFADDCGALDGVEREQCTYARMLAHVKRHFRVPGSVRHDLNTRIDFVVDTSGRVGAITCAPAVDRDVRMEIVRVLRRMDRLEPGTQGGHPVEVRYSLPLVVRVK